MDRFNESFRLRSSNRDASSACDSSAKGTIAMAKVVKVIELMSQSPKSWEDAAQGAAAEASKTLRNICSIYVKEFTAEVDGGKISNYRINAKVTFDLER
jgi:dodecin